MSWATAGSAIFRSFITDALSGDVSGNLTSADVYKVALFNNTTAPDKDATSANSCYNAGQWVTANEVYHAGGHWDQAGQTAAGLAISNPSTGVIMFDMTDTASTDAATTLASVYGSLLYNDSSTTPSDQGVCFNYFGGSNSVTAGTLTVVWHANGLFRITV